MHRLLLRFVYLCFYRHQCDTFNHIHQDFFQHLVIVKMKDNLTYELIGPDFNFCYFIIPVRHFTVVIIQGCLTDNR